MSCGMDERVHNDTFQERKSMMDYLAEMMKHFGFGSPVACHAIHR